MFKGTSARCPHENLTPFFCLLRLSMPLGNAEQLHQPQANPDTNRRLEFWETTAPNGAQLHLRATMQLGPKSWAAPTVLRPRMLSSLRSCSTSAAFIREACRKRGLNSRKQSEPKNCDLSDLGLVKKRLRKILLVQKK